MPVKPLKLSPHALNMLVERHIDRSWIEHTLNLPDWTEADSNPARIRAFKSIAERDGRVLRVVFTETDLEIRGITAFFDRNAKKP